MNKIIGYLFFIFLGLGWQQSSAQVYKFSTTGFSVLEKNEKGKWGNWSELELTKMMVSLDTNKNRIVIYSQIIQLFEIVEYQPVSENESDLVYSFSCKDNDGVACTLAIITRKKQDNRKQLYINYGNQIIVYNIFNAD
jgi:accessory gene regulator protein AgrB